MGYKNQDKWGGRILALFQLAFLLMFKYEGNEQSTQGEQMNSDAIKRGE